MSTEMKFKEETENYEKNKKSAEIFEDFCSCVMMKRLGIPLVNFKSEMLQYRGFENYQGIEIKYQPRFKNQENRGLYIEVGEKRHKKNKNYVPSGIMRNDKAWLFLMGNYETLYLLSKKVLRAVYEETYKEKTKNYSTSQGFRLPIKEVDECCELKLDNLKEDFPNLIPESFYEDLKPIPRLEEINKEHTNNQQGGNHEG